MNFLDDTALAKAEAMLREWAEYVSLGRGGSVPTSRERENARRAPSSAPDPVWITCQVEQFFETGRNMQFRAYALAAYWHGKHVGDWVWYVPWWPRWRSCAALGWDWVQDKHNPLPEVKAEFWKRFGAWVEEHPITSTASLLPDEVGDFQGFDYQARIVSVRVACILLEMEHLRQQAKDALGVDLIKQPARLEAWAREHPEARKEFAIRTVRDWCAKGLFKGASKTISADWVIPYGSLRDFAAPKRGRRRKSEKSEHKHAA